LAAVRSEDKGRLAAQKISLEVDDFPKNLSTLAKGKVEIQFLASLPNEF